MSATKCKGDLGGCQAHAANLEHIPRPARAGHPLQKGDMGCMTPRPCLFSRPLLSSRHGPGLHAPPLRHRRVSIPHDSTVTDSRPSGAILPVSAAWRKQRGGMWQRHAACPVWSAVAKRSATPLCPGKPGECPETGFLCRQESGVVAAAVQKTCWDTHHQACMPSDLLSGD